MSSPNIRPTQPMSSTLGHRNLGPSRPQSGATGTSPSMSTSRLVGNFGAFNFGNRQNQPQSPTSSFSSPSKFGSSPVYRSGLSGSLSGGVIAPVPASPSCTSSTQQQGASFSPNRTSGELRRNPCHSPRSATKPANPEVVELVKQDMPLQNRWCFWLDTFNAEENKGENYEKFLKVVCTVGTVQEFWGAVNNMKGPETLATRHCYHFMKEGIKPTWEDPRNQAGGTYVFRVKKQHSPEVWREILMVLIGEQLQDCIPDDDEICGITFSSRWSMDSFRVWNGNREAHTPKVMEYLSRALQHVDIKSSYYKAHRDHLHFGKGKLNSIPIATSVKQAEMRNHNPSIGYANRRSSVTQSSNASDATRVETSPTSST
ncbi:hypothetical protein IWQ61_000534 [Dispira simplex]|nr:hypothetical protein IWQ61_000534 [Dispira simplex]